MSKPSVYIAAADPGRRAWAFGRAAALGWSVANATVDTAPVLGWQARGDRALQCTTAIHQSDVLWLLAPREPSADAWWELAYAYSSGVPCVVSGFSEHRLFGALALECETDEEGLRVVASLCQRAA